MREPPAPMFATDDQLARRARGLQAIVAELQSLARDLDGALGEVSRQLATLAALVEPRDPSPEREEQR